MPGNITDVERGVHSLAEAICENEKYFGELDAVVGDGDFGYSLARGFEVVLEKWDEFDRTDPGVLISKVAMAFSARVGGTSGPIWGTAFLRMGSALKGSDEFTAADVVRGGLHRLYLCHAVENGGSRAVARAAADELGENHADLELARVRRAWAAPPISANSRVSPGCDRTPQGSDTRPDTDR